MKQLPRIETEKKNISHPRGFSELYGAMEMPTSVQIHGFIFRCAVKTEFGQERIVLHRIMAVDYADALCIHQNDPSFAEHTPLHVSGDI